MVSFKYQENLNPRPPKTMVFKSPVASPDSTRSVSVFCMVSTCSGGVLALLVRGVWDLIWVSGSLGFRAWGKRARKFLRLHSELCGRQNEMPLMIWKLKDLIVLFPCSPHYSCSIVQPKPLLEFVRPLFGTQLPGLFVCVLASFQLIEEASGRHCPQK